MAADLREMQKNQWVSEIRIDKLRFVEMEYTINTGFSEDKIFPALLRKAAHRKSEPQFLLLFYTSISIPHVSLNTIRSLP